MTANERGQRFRKCDTSIRNPTTQSESLSQDMVPSFDYVLDGNDICDHTVVVEH